MFFKNKRNTRRNGHIDTLIGSGTVIHGDVRFRDGLHIDGTIKGNVMAEGDHSMLTMSEKGRIEGEVWVHDIVLNGEVLGDVHASHHVELAPNARVTGNVYYSLIEMAMGAEVNGSLVHEPEPASPQSSEPAAESSEAPDLAASQS
jgi:cytoskeletal protein CcmA (bactofilin family)